MVKNNLKTAALVGGGLAAVAGIAGALFIWREKQTERAAYSVVVADGAIEVRDYPDLIVAQTEDGGTRDDALGEGFDTLAAYIFGTSRGGDDADRPHEIAMTAPVLSDRAEAGSWRTRFVMPRGETLDTLPEPGPGVSIQPLPARRVAAIKFSGLADDALLAAHERDLRAWLLQRSYLPAAPAEYAFYDSPFVPGPLRRTEVLIPLAQ
ncbi:heme-binding protein [Sphingomonas sp. SUN019]|uniref:SOUL family heme-binding protein n=1 Tax=Sphingomonas sp. SUN019 TaxID=2937788 RepID=UPI00216421D7|nr:heme-binding protein [Sphingomonas sp. SUN019]UVO51804.1 heme-binding protein [Sphingomonas sp. SUN019]